MRRLQSTDVSLVTAVPCHYRLESPPHSLVERLISRLLRQALLPWSVAAAVAAPSAAAAPAVPTQDTFDSVKVVIRQLLEERKIPSPGILPTADAARETTTIGLDLRLQNGRLSGSISALAPNVYALSSFAALERTPMR